MSCEGETKTEIYDHVPRRPKAEPNLLIKLLAVSTCPGLGTWEKLTVREPPASARALRMERLSPSGAGALSPPPLPPRPAENENDNGGCSCAAVDPVTMESAWEKMSAMKATAGSTSNGSGNASSARVKVSSPAALDLRIFCGTWNVAGKRT